MKGPRAAAPGCKIVTLPHVGVMHGVLERRERVERPDGTLGPWRWIATLEPPKGQREGRIRDVALLRSDFEILSWPDGGA